jgi:hypothetical protein
LGGGAFCSPTTIVLEVPSAMVAVRLEDRELENKELDFGVSNLLSDSAIPLEVFGLLLDLDFLDSSAPVVAACLSIFLISITSYNCHALD